MTRALVTIAQLADRRPDAVLAAIAAVAVIFACLAVGGVVALTLQG